MRIRAGIGGASVLLLSGCGLVGLGDPASDDPEVTFRGTTAARSMEPTIMSGDRITATAVPDGGPVVGDVVVYPDPGTWLGVTPGEGQLVHRVMGVPGDTLTCCDAEGRLAVDGVPLDEPYLADVVSCNAAIHRGIDRDACDWTIGPVPVGSVFVLGETGTTPPTHASTCARSRTPTAPMARGSRSS